MNTHTQNQAVNGGIVTAIGILVLLLGTATGNAMAMLAMAVIALAGIAIFYRRHPGRTTWLAMIASVAVAAVTAFVITVAR